METRMIALFFRHGSNALLAALLAVIALTVWTTGLRAPWWAWGLGALIFFVSEYTTHRFLFHAKPSAHPLVLQLQHRMHYDHHTDPERLDLLFLPPWFVVPVFAFYGLAYLFVTRDWGVALCLLGGNLAALLYYEWVHYIAHIAFVPVTPFGRWIKKYHLLHHFKNEHFWFGVTNPGMDLLTGTYREKGSVARSASTRRLF
ncbi:MAG: hypothetical protein NVS9B12_01390 [Vulcanimicrobiaceae bacterium]